MKRIIAVIDVADDHGVEDLNGAALWLETISKNEVSVTAYSTADDAAIDELTKNGPFERKAAALPRLAPVAELETPRMLVLTTGHVKQSTAQDLDVYCNPCTLGEDRPKTVPIAFGKGEYGWIIAILPDSEEDFSRWTDDLLEIRKVAVAAGCTWIMLDRDADLVEGLPEYEW